MIYLDHAATTVPRPEARAALDVWLDPEARAGNASSAHGSGRTARMAVEQARESVADALGARPHDIVFTSGGTEADNLAVKGVAWARAQEGHRHLVVSAVEHPAVLESAQWLAEHDGFALDVVAAGRDGRVDPERVLDTVRDDTALVSVMAANNELGSVNDIPTLGRALRDRGVPFHVDAVQAFSTLDVDVREWPVDALALSAHKFGGPGGVGVAYLRRGVPVVALQHGGGQDRGVRSGTFATALDAACGAAVTATVRDRAELRETLRDLSDQLIDGMRTVGGVRRNGPDDPADRLASHVHVSVEGVDAEALMFALDQGGLEVSTGSACHSGANRASHVLTATGLDDLASVRASLGWTTDKTDVDTAVGVFVEAVARVRAAGGGAVA